MQRREAVFVFGSNHAGRHGKGAAKEAEAKYGAKRGQGEGLAGRSYGVPTKDAKLRTLTLDEVRAHVERFMEFARERQDLVFAVTRVGCGLAGFRDEDIAPLFANSPRNCELPREWLKMVGR
ncbi:MAG: hypothetical protein JST54_31455 [Deltaproteobacteria bacterium]|nr:hypothetical protein [Deltaproteobacteria bacterium]